MSVSAVVPWFLCDWVSSFFYDPFRDFATIKGNFNSLRLACASARGATTLEWIRAFPGQPIIRWRELGLRNYLLVADEEMIRDVLVNKAIDFEKPQMPRTIVGRLLGRGLAVSEGHEHRKQRFAMGPSVAAKNIRSFYPVIIEKVDRFLGQIEESMCRQQAGKEGKSAEGVVDMDGWIRYLMVEIIGVKVLGHDWGVEPGAQEKVAECFARVLDPSVTNIFYFTIYNVWPRWIVSLVPWSHGSLTDSLKDRLRVWCLDSIKRSQDNKNEIENENIDTSVIESMDHRGDFTASELSEQAMALLAGFESPSLALFWCCFELARHHEFQEKLRTEVRSHLLAEGCSQKWETIEALPLLNAFCREVLRLHPPVSVTIRQSVRDTVIGDVDVPANTRLFISAYAMQRRHDIWGPRGDEFWPERWLDLDENGNASLNQMGGATSMFAYMPFLHGRRACVAKELAYAGMRCVVAGLIGRFAMELQDSAQEVKVGD
ncbi:hypothetical protein FE257_000077 [Aspergillus nanangensis]|uniref:Cytochrome P450 n=1 Tax=Aspergillus nanangensis TaxID=2582783 RepID=A0AAD4CYQ2_ASPNN|nr:hypothetical protein FE257_000077 [Aspergillus nanangensis]